MVTSPFSSTVATRSSSDVQTTAVLSALAGYTLASNCSVVLPNWLLSTLSHVPVALVTFTLSTITVPGLRVGRSATIFGNQFQLLLFWYLSSVP